MRKLQDKVIEKINSTNTDSTDWASTAAPGATKGKAVAFNYCTFEESLVKYKILHLTAFLPYMMHIHLTCLMIPIFADSPQEQPV